MTVVGRTDRLLVSRMTIEDASGIHEALSDPEVRRYLGDTDAGDVADVRSRIETVLRGPADPTQAWVNFTLRERSGSIIGRLEATLNPGWAEVAWILGAPWWGRGLGTEAGVWLAGYLDDECGIHEIWASVHPDNAASIGIMRRLGMVMQSDPHARNLQSRDPGDLVFARCDDPQA